VTTADSPGDDVSYRRILGRYPTGVCIVTALPEQGDPVGMVVGSFTSVSLDPPLVGFFPGRYSSTWPRIASAGRFCVNVLSQEQLSLCERFSSKGGSRFDAIQWDITPGGAPRFADVMAWIDCDVFSVTDAGDHLLVLGRVTDIAAGSGRSPLIFFEGGYGQFCLAD
jgi:3-hydroxy-9,10-secoandrosta-1,3,5(10)-triene-9,17-dione monooxygenase reductase component